MDDAIGVPLVEGMEVVYCRAQDSAIYFKEAIITRLDEERGKVWLDGETDGRCGKTPRNLIVIGEG